MSILPGIYASQITGHLSTNSYESIATVTVGAGGQSSISFTSIPSTYKHLQIRAIDRSLRSNVNDNRYIGFNTDTTTSNYNAHALYGDGASAGAFQLSGVQTGFFSISDGATALANAYTGLVIDILDYSNTSKNKTVRTLGGYDLNGSGQVFLTSSLWLSTAAINSIQLTSYYAGMAQYSSFALYGVKG